MVVDGRTVASEIGSLGDNIEACENGDTFIGNEVHDMAFAFLADELESQERSQRLLGRDHGRTGEFCPANNIRETQLSHQGNKDEQSAQTCAKGPRFQVNGVYVGDSSEFGPSDDRALVVTSAGQTREAFFAEENRQRVYAKGMSGLCKFRLNVVDGEVLFAHGDNKLANAVAARGLARTIHWSLKERRALVGVVTKLVAQDAEGPGRIAETGSDFVGAIFFNEVSAECLVLALRGRIRG